MCVAAGALQRVYVTASRGAVVALTHRRSMMVRNRFWEKRARISMSAAESHWPLEHNSNWRVHNFQFETESELGADSQYVSLACLTLPNCPTEQLFRWAVGYDEP